MLLGHQNKKHASSNYSADKIQDCDANNDSNKCFLGEEDSQVVLLVAPETR